MNCSSFLKKFIAISAILFSSRIFAEIFILSPDSSYALNVAERINTKLQTEASVVLKLPALGDEDIVIALGEMAIHHSLESSNARVVGTFVNSGEYKSKNNSRPLSALIFRDPSPTILSGIFTKELSNKRIGYIYTDDDMHIVKALEKGIENSSASLITIKSEGDTFKDIRSILKKKIDILYINSNRNIYKSDNIRFVIESLFRKKIPVVASSKALIAAGAAVSFSSPEELVIDETINAINHLLVEPLPTASQNSTYVSRIEININKTMSELFSMDIEEGSRL